MLKNHFLVYVLILCSCNNRTSDDGFMETASRVEYKIISSAIPGDSIQPGDVVKVHLQQFADDSLMNDTRTHLAEYIKIDSSLREFDYSEILHIMKVSDSAVCRFSTKEILKRSAAATHPPHFLEENRFIYVYFKVVEKFSADSLAYNDYERERHRFDSLTKAREEAGFVTAEQAFDSLISAVKAPLKKLGNGVFVQLLEKGKGKKIVKGDSVSVVYKGFLQEGTLFEETNYSNAFIFKTGQQEAVEGFDSGIQSLAFGDKARLYIPARLAYGITGAGIKIPPYANLVFEVHVNIP